MSGEKKGTNVADIGGLLFVGFLMIGFSRGFYYGNVPIGMFAGMGVGLIAMGLANYLVRAQ